MIDVLCIKCQAAMQVDDAFAGSACRCQKCGTIQTVPGRRRAAQPEGAGTRTLYTRHARGTSSGTGLDALADVVASSGLSSGLRENTTASQSSPRRTGLIAAIIGGAVGVVVAAIVMFAVTRPDSAQPPTSAVPMAQSTAHSSPRGPQFCGIELNEPTIIYVLDRGNSTRDSMGYLVSATLQSVRSLGANRRFQVIFWDNGQAEIAYPAGGPQYATPETVNAAQRVLEGVVAYGRTDATPALKKAFAAKPGAVVLVTAKGMELDSVFSKLTTDLRAAAGGITKVHTVSIGDGGEAMPRIAEATGGVYRAVTPGELRDAGQ